MTLSGTFFGFAGAGLEKGDRLAVDGKSAKSFCTVEFAKEGQLGLHHPAL
jgi:hypothetical protein